LLFLAIVSFNGVSFNARYLLFLEIPVRILAARYVVLTCLGHLPDGGLNTRIKTILAVGFVLVNALVEWSLFQEVFLVGDVYDPVSWALLKTQRFIP